MYFLIDEISLLYIIGKFQGYTVWNIIARTVGNPPSQNYHDENWVWLFLFSQALIMNGNKTAFPNARGKFYWVSYKNKIAFMTLKQKGSMNQKKIIPFLSMARAWCKSLYQVGSTESGFAR